MDGPAAYEAVVNAHGARLQRLCGLILGDREEAAEVVQEVFLKAFQRAGQPDPPADWTPWLTRVAVNACRDRHRAGWWIRFRRRSDPADDLTLADDAPSAEDRAISRETRGRIWQAFQALPDRQREVFILRHVEEWSTEEVATALGLHAGTVKRHLFRAIRRLRTALRES